MRPRRFFYLALGLFALVLLGMTTAAGAGVAGGATSAQAAGGEQISLAVAVPRHAGQQSPRITATPSLPDYIPEVSWDARYACPYPVLDITTRNIGTNYTCQYSYTRITNSAGDYREFRVPNEPFAFVTAPCQVGPCIPFSWLQSTPFTVTADYGNGIQESNESNNTLVFSDPPPQSTACTTVTTTPTSIPSITPTVTHTPAIPDLVGSAQWVAQCPVPVLELTTQLYGGPCAYAGSNVMRLQNSAGQYLDFPVPPLRFDSTGTRYDYDCAVGNCMPASWLSYMPFTLTVDVHNQVYEANETNNVSTFSMQPGPCGSTTATSSPTPTLTATATCAPGMPDLVAHANWTSECSINGGVLHMTTELVGAGPVTTTTMHLADNYGHEQDFTVPPLSNNQSYTVDQPWYAVGFPPLTITVDYYNVVQECNENNNSVVISYVPPTTTPCPSETPVPTHTRTPSPTPTTSLTPTNTPTYIPDCPDFTGNMMWVGTCPAPVLRLVTNLYYPLPFSTGPTHMRLQNNNGDHVDFPVPALGQGTYTYYYDCVVGSCIPSSWVAALPFTLIVDVFNEVQECNENNNTYSFWYPPPAPTPCSITPTPCVVNFSDVHPSDYFYQDVAWLYCHGAISGYADGTFRPYNNTSRGQTCKIVVIAFGFPINTQGGPHFTDVPPGSPFYDWIETAYNRGIVSGYADGTFRPGNNVTRAQLTKIICLAAGWPLSDPPTPAYSDVPPGSPFYTYVMTAACNGIISGYADGTFRPNNNAVRAQVAKMVSRAVTGGYSCATPTVTAAPR